MKIYRGPHTTDHWASTDTKSLQTWSKDWHPRKTIRFDGTINKKGRRHTDLGVAFESDDIVALANGLFDYYKSIEKNNSELQQTIEALEKALGKIDDLISIHRKKAPDVEQLVSAIQKIASNYRWSVVRKIPPNIKWIEWDAI